MDDRIIQIQKLLDAVDGNLSSARTIMRELTTDDSAPLDLDKKLENLSTSEEGKVIEGVFDGEQMVGPDNQTYPVPPNYASKSKLVEGDTLKLTIANDGSFLFKQISPTERRNAIGTLAQTDGGYTISAEGKSYKVLTASVTFYKAEPGDQVTIILPKEHDAVWAVLENVIQKTDIVTEDVVQPVIPTAPELSSPTSQIKSDELTGDLPEVELGDPHLRKDDKFLNAQEKEIVMPEAVETPADTAVVAPEIEFPGGEPTISDEQLLENLKNNLKNLEQPVFTQPESLIPKPVDNIVANDLANLTNNQPIATIPSDKPIAELDI